MALRNYHCAETKADFYNRITTDGEFGLLLGDASKGDIKAQLWQYVANSTATDDFTNGVIKPTLQTGDGRWLRQSNFPKRKETYSGTTSGSGTYTVTFGVAFLAAPNIQATIVGGTDTQFLKVTSVSTTGFIITTMNRTDVLGLLPTYTATNGIAVDVLVTDK
jgi:hypothetical protein